MTSSDFTLSLFCRVDDALPDAPRHPLAFLHPSEVVTLGLLHALKGGGGRAFYRWVERELKPLFPRLPERTRLFRLLTQHASLTPRFLAQPTLLGVCDSFGIELLHPRREGRSPRQIGRKMLSNVRWVIGAKLVVLCNSQGQIVKWLCASASCHDSLFHALIESVGDQMVVLTDQGFHAKEDDPDNLLVCRKGKWNERMLIETIFSLFTRVLGLKRMANRSWLGLRTRLAYVVAAFNLCTSWTGEVKLQLAPFAL